MDNSFIVQSLVPFISENEVAYYSKLDTNKLTLLVSLAPFVDNSDSLMELSKLDNITLQELIGKIPNSYNEAKKYLTEL